MGEDMNTYKNVTVLKENNEGNGICRINNIITFVPYSLKNEVIDLEITKEYKNFYNGKLLKINTTSKDRREALCKYYYLCGGCNLMHMRYDYQLNIKKENVINNLKHIADMQVDNIDIISDSEYHYRNHVIFSVNNDKIGFFSKNTNDIVDINECIISNENINIALNEIKKFILKYSDNCIQKISIKSYNGVLINIISDNFKYINEFKKYVKYSSLYINDKYVDGLHNVTENISNYIYNISSNSFFQKNTKIALKLYDYIKSNIKNNDNVLDLYCGTGSIGIYVSDKCKSVIGIEEVKSAIEDAILNAKTNNVSNIDFILGKVEDSIDEVLNIDLVIVDPPRTGLSRKVINNILKINAKTIIYVSCNSSTLARDLKILKEQYELKNIKLFDMFPNTYHVECVCIMKLC